jgi:hypothetical protein
VFDVGGQRLGVLLFSQSWGEKQVINGIQTHLEAINCRSCARFFKRRGSIFLVVIRNSQLISGSRHNNQLSSCNTSKLQYEDI